MYYKSPTFGDDDHSWPSQRVFGKTPTGADCTLFTPGYKYIYGAFYSRRFCSETATLGLKRSMRLAVWTEDADGGRNVVLAFEKLSAEIMQLACAPFCASGCQSAFSFYTKIKLALAISLTFLPGVSFACRKTLFMSSGRGEKQTSSALWAGTASYCVASPASLSTDLSRTFSALFSCSWAARRLVFSFRSHRLWGGSFWRPLSRPHTTNSEFVLKRFAPRTSLYTLQGILRCLLLQHYYVLVSKGGICVYVPILWFGTSCWRPTDAGWRKTGLGSETASRANTSPGLQVETIPDWSPICFHFRIVALN